jgi:hypothetical protein
MGEVMDGVMYVVDLAILSPELAGPVSKNLDGSH